MDSEIGSWHERRPLTKRHESMVYLRETTSSCNDVRPVLAWIVLRRTWSILLSARQLFASDVSEACLI